MAKTINGAANAPTKMPNSKLDSFLYISRYPNGRLVRISSNPFVWNAVKLSLCVAPFLSSPLRIESSMILMSRREGTTRIFALPRMGTLALAAPPSQLS